MHMSLDVSCLTAGWWVLVSSDVEVGLEFKLEVDVVVAVVGFNLDGNVVKSLYRSS